MNPPIDFVPDEPEEESPAIDFVPDEPAAQTAAIDFVPDEPEEAEPGEGPGWGTEMTAEEQSQVEAQGAYTDSAAARMNLRLGGDPAGGTALLPEQFEAGRAADQEGVSWDNVGGLMDDYEALEVSLLGREEGQGMDIYGEMDRAFREGNPEELQRLEGTESRMRGLSEKLGSFVKRHQPTDPQREAQAAKARKHNLANPDYAKPPEMLAGEERALQGMFFAKPGDGFDDLRDRFAFRDEMFKTMWEGREGLELPGEAWAKHLPFASGPLKLAFAWEYKKAFKELEKTPPVAFGKYQRLIQAEKQGDADEVKKIAASITAEEMESVTSYAGAIAGATKYLWEMQKQGEISEDNWKLFKNILYQAPGFITEFVMTGGAATLGSQAIKKMGVNRAQAMVRKATQNKMARWSSKFAGGAARWTGAAAAQTAALPGMTASFLAGEMNVKRENKVDPVTGVRTFDAGDNLTLDEYSHALTGAFGEIGSERLGEAFMAMKWVKNSKIFGGAAKRAGGFAGRAGFQGTIVEIGEERANELFTYMHDVASGRDELSWARLDARTADIDQVGIEFAAFAITGFGLSQFQGVKNSAEMEKLRVEWGNHINRARRPNNPWSETKAQEKISTDPKLAELNNFTGRVILFQDPDGGAVSYVTLEPDESGNITNEATAAAWVQHDTTNPGMIARGVFRIKAGQASRVISGTWTQEGEEKSFTFDSPEAAHAHAQGLLEAGAEDAAMELYQQTVEQMSPGPPTVTQLDMMDDSVVARGTRMRHLVPRAELEAMGLEVKDTDAGYLLRMPNGTNIKLEFGKVVPETEAEIDAWIASALSSNAITQAEVDAATTPEARRALFLGSPSRAAGEAKILVNGKGLDQGWLIRLDLNADMSTFRHEWLHVLKGNGVISPKEWNNIVESLPGEQAKANREALAKAREEGKEEAIRDLEDSVEEDVAHYIENRLNGRAPGESWFGHKIMQTLGKIRDLFGKLNAAGLSRSIHTGAIGKRKPGEAAESEAGSFSVQRNEELKKAAEAMKAGTLTGAQYRGYIDKLDPIIPNEVRPIIPTREDMERYLSGEKRRAKIGMSRELVNGKEYDLRIDIGSYNRSQEDFLSGKIKRPVVVVTAHAPKNFNEGKSWKAGKALGYDGIAKIKGWATVKQDEDYALDIAAGEAKNTISAISGKYNSSKSIPRDIMSWRQVGYNPIRSSKYYDKENGVAVLEMLDPIIIGTTVYARDVKYDPSGARYSIQSAPSGFASVLEWNKFLGRLDSTGEQVTKDTDANLRHPGDVVEAMISVRNGARNPEIAEMADMIGDLVSAQWALGSMPASFISKSKLPGRRGNLGEYYPSGDSTYVYSYSSEQPKDLVAIHEVVHSFTSLISLQYASSAMRDSTGKAFLKRLASLRDQIRAGKRKVVTVDAADLYWDEKKRKWVQPETITYEKAAPSGKDLAVANMIDLYLESIKKIGPSELTGYDDYRQFNMIVKPANVDSSQLAAGLTHRVAARDSESKADVVRALKKMGLTRAEYDRSTGMVSKGDYEVFGSFIAISKAGYEKLESEAFKPENKKLFAQGPMKSEFRVNTQTGAYAAGLELVGAHTAKRHGTVGGPATGKGSTFELLGHKHYGWSNLHEFMAEAMSNPAFQLQLMQIDKGPARKASGWMGERAKAGHRLAKAARGILRSEAEGGILSLQSGTQPGLHAQHNTWAKQAIKTADLDRHTMLDEVAMAISDMAYTRKPDYGTGREKKWPHYSVQANDQAYMQAVLDLDTKKAQKLVDKAAKAAGYTVRGWHATPAEFQEGAARGGKFTVFDTDPAMEFGAHFGTKEHARNRGKVYRNRDVRIVSAWLKLRNPFRIPEDPGSFGSISLESWKKWLEDQGVDASGLTKAKDSEVGTHELIDPDGAYRGRTRRRDVRLESGEIVHKGLAIRRVLEEAGYDGIVYKNDREITPGSSLKDSYIVFDPSQIKSADPITHTGDANIIPLSERFQTESDDIRYSVQGKGGYVVEQRFIGPMGEGSEWETAPWMESESGLEEDMKSYNLFKTREEAQAEIDDLIDSMAGGFIEDAEEQRSDYRIVWKGPEDKSAGSYSVQPEEEPPTEFISNIPGTSQTQAKFGDMYSRVTRAIESMPMKKATMQKWLGRLKKLTAQSGRTTPKAYGMGQSEGILPEELEELGLEENFRPGEEVTREDLLDFIEKTPVPEVTFKPMGHAALLGTEWEGMTPSELYDEQRGMRKNLDRDLISEETRKNLQERLDRVEDLEKRLSEGTQHDRENLEYMRHDVRRMGHGTMLMKSPSTSGYRNHVYEEQVVAWTRFNLHGKEQLDFIESQSDLHQAGARDGYGITTKEVKEWEKTGWDLQWKDEGLEVAKASGVFEAQEELDEIKWLMSTDDWKELAREQAFSPDARVFHSRAGLMAEEHELLVKAQANGEEIFYHSGNYYTEVRKLERATWSKITGRIFRGGRGIYVIERGPHLYGLKEGATADPDVARDEIFKKYFPQANLARDGKQLVEKWVSLMTMPSSAGMAYVTLEKTLTPTIRAGLQVRWEAHAPNIREGGSREWFSHSAAGDMSADEYKKLVAENIEEVISHADSIPRAVHRSDWHESNFRALVQFAAQNGVKYVTWPSKWQQVEEIEGHYNPAGNLPRLHPSRAITSHYAPIYRRMISGTMKEAKRLAKRHGAKITKMPAGGLEGDPATYKKLKEEYVFHALEITPEMAGPMARYSVQGNWGLNILKGKGKPKGLPKHPTIMDVAHMFQDDFENTIIYQEDDARQNARLERALLNEIKHAYKLHPEAAGWYDENLGLAMSVLTEADPEISKPANKFIFTATLAITSDGNKVDGQFGQAWNIYQEWKKTGKLNAKLAFGDRQGNIRNNLKVAMDMFELYGPEKSTEMLAQVRSVGDHVEFMVEELGMDKKIANALKGKVGELVSSEVPFAAMMFGPKLGSFFSNLEGDYSNVTMDRWFMRTIGRLTGTYLKPVDLNAPRGTKANPKPSALDRLRQAIRAISSEERKRLGINTRSASGEKGAIDTAKKMSRYFGDPKLGAERRGPGVKDGGSVTWNEARNSANSIITLLKPVVDTPENGGHRAWIRQRMNNVREKLASQGIHLENADIQALLWYSEKELYDKLGIKGPKGANDYASASEGVFQRVRGGPSRSYAEGTGRVGGIGSGRPGEKGDEVGKLSVQPVQVTPAAQGRINHIEAGGSYTAPPPEAAPAYGKGYLSDFQKRHLARASQKLIYFAGKKTAHEKGVLQIEEAYAAAAVRKAQVEVIKKLTSSAYDSQSGWKLPKWMGVGKWARRMNKFLENSIHLAAHLNATSRDSSGKMTFSDFEMRAGLMSQKDFNKGKHQVGDKILVVNKLTGENDELVIGAFITTADGRAGYQLTRQMNAATQEEIYNHFRQEYPDMIWAIDMYIDPSLKHTRQVINGVEVPMLNRFSLEQILADSDPTFEGVQGYTPDVIATRSLVGGLLGVFNPREGGRSPGRRYKTGKVRESGNVKDLFTGHTVRSFQALQEKHRQRFTQIILKHTAKPLEKGEGPGNLPEGWVMLEDGMTQVIQRVKAFKDFIETENFDGPAFYKKFIGELYASRGRQLKIRREAVEALMQQYIRIQFNNKIYNIGAWAVRNSKGMLLAHPGTMVVNAATNDLFTFEAAFQNLMKGISLLPVDKKQGKISMRMAQELMIGNFLHRFPSIRKLAGLTTHYDEIVESSIPEEIFSSSVNLQDLEVKYETTAGQYIREGEIGAASLQLLQYGNIDIRAKQRMTYAFLKAHAVQEGRDQGLRGKDLKDFVDRFMKNPSRDLMVKAAEAANLEFLNYADSPAWLQWFSASSYTALIMPFPRFGYHFMAKQIDKGMAVRKLVQKVPAEERAEAFGKVMAFSLFSVGGAGLLLDMLLSPGGDDDDARERIGTSYTKYTDPVTGEVMTKQIDRQQITTARVNLSWYARKLGLGNPDTEEDFWWRVRNYPMIAMAGNAILAAEDAEKYGAWEGAKTMVRSTTDLSKDFFSLGAGVKVPAKVWAELQNEPGKPKKVSAADPYATNVPLGYYLTEQGMTSVVPGTRQFSDLAALIEPTRPKKTASKSLGYEPGPWEAIRAAHMGSVLSRWAEKEGLIKPLPRQGSVVTMSPLPTSGDDLQRQVDRAQGLGKLGGPEANIFIDPRTYQPRLATIPEGSIAERTRNLELLRIFGLNLKPVKRGAYEEALKPPIPKLPGAGR